LLHRKRQQRGIAARLRQFRRTFVAAGSVRLQRRRFVLRQSAESQQLELF
jgi:hypothetical protein